MSAERLFVLAVDFIYGALFAFFISSLSNQWPVPLVAWPVLAVVGMLAATILFFLFRMNIDAFSRPS